MKYLVLIILNSNGQGSAQNNSGIKQGSERESLRFTGFPFHGKPGKET